MFLYFENLGGHQLNVMPCSSISKLYNWYVLGLLLDVVQTVESPKGLSGKICPREFPRVIRLSKKSKNVYPKKQKNSENIKKSQQLKKSKTVSKLNFFLNILLSQKLNAFLFLVLQFEEISIPVELSSQSHFRIQVGGTLSVTNGEGQMTDGNHCV